VTTGCLTALRDSFWTLTFVNDERVLQKAIDIYGSLAERLSSASGEWSMNVMFQPIPTLFSEHSVKKGGNVLGLDRATENLVCTSAQSRCIDLYRSTR